MLRYSVIFCALFALSLASHPTFIVQFQWNYINYTWPSKEAYSTAKSDGSYIEKNNIISGIKIWKDKMYLSIPRYKEGVPVTLAVTSATVQNGTTEPLLEPYPNWDMQKIDNCSALQNVYNMEIDLKGRMWVLDSGRVATMTSAPKNYCPPRLVIFDLENNGTVLNYIFLKNVVNYESAILKDIVIDHEHGGMAYITDSDEENPGLIAYSLANNTSWKVYHSSMHYLPEAVGFQVDGINFVNKINVNGIALSPASLKSDERMVYFSPLSSFNLFAVSAQALIDAQHKQEEEREEEISEYIEDLGRKKSQSDGMVMSNTGRLYYGLLNNDEVSIWESKSNRSFVEGQRTVSSDHSLMQWPSSFSFDNKGQLWCIINRFHLYANDSLDITKANFRVTKSRMYYEYYEDEHRMRSYQYYEDNTASEWPDIKMNVKSQP